MVPLLISLRKEWVLLVRDWHALLVLFVMPSAFVLIMSLALQENFAGHQGLRLEGYVQREDPSHIAKLFQDELMMHPALHLEAVEIAPAAFDQYSFGVEILPQFSRAYNRQEEARVGVELRFSPTLGLRERLLVQAATQEAFAHFNTALLADELGFDREYAEEEFLKTGFIATASETETPLRPNAVQQNVPAWLIFAMFFIAIPVSTTFIQERQQKTLIRLRTLGTPVGTIFAAKLLPYLVINLVQLLLMLAIGAWLMPLLGAQALSLDVSLPGLALISLSVSVAALGFASFIATIARSVEQATVMSGACNILFAALGGIMIPTFIMPPVMQQISNLSPMAWGLQGYLEILLRDGTAASVAPVCAALASFGLGAFLLSTFILRTEKYHD
jgi:ABC-2 type transport system permease protein